MLLDKVTVIEIVGRAVTIVTSEIVVTGVEVEKGFRC